MAGYPGGVASLGSNVGVSDMCLLEELTEDQFIANLQARFDYDQIYVSITEWHDCYTCRRWL